MRTLIDFVYRRYIRSKPCIVAVALGRVDECEHGVQACHRDHSGMGGKDVPDHGNLFPACGLHHGEEHSPKMGRKAFEAKYGLDIDAVCAQLEHEDVNGVEWPDEPWGAAVAHL